MNRPLRRRAIASGVAASFIALAVVPIPRTAHASASADPSAIQLIRGGAVADLAIDPTLRPGPLPRFFEPSMRFHRTLAGLPNGDLNLRFVDVLLPAPGEPLAVKREYRSGRPQAGVFGAGWSSNLDIALHRVAGTNDREIVESDGTVSEYRSLGDGTYRTVLPAAAENHLEHGSDGSFARTWGDGTVERFDPNGRFVARESAGGALRVGYASRDAVLPSTLEQNGLRLTVKYAGARVSEIDDPLNRAVKYAYAGNHLASVTDALGRQTTFTYAGDRLAELAVPSGAKVRFAYAADGALHEVTGPGTVATTFRWRRNGAQLHLDTTDNAGHAASLTIAPDVVSGRPAFRFDDSGIAAPATATTFADGTIRFSGSGFPGGVALRDGALPNVDPTGTLAAIATLGEHWHTLATPALAQTGERDVTYDAAGRPIAFRAGGNVLEQWKWDDGDRLVQWTDAVGGARTYTYDTDNRLTGISAGSGDVTFAYDAGGSLAKIVRPNRPAVTFAYDPAGLVTAIVDERGTTTVAYDAAGRAIRMRSPLGEQSFAYDGAGRLASAGVNGRVVTTYAYGADGALIERRDDGVATRYEYDAAHRITSATLGTRATMKVAYANDGALTVDGSARSGTWQIGYDAAGRPTRIDSTLGHLTARYDERGALAALEGPAGRAEYRYDARGLLTGAAEPGSSETKYGYDAAGRPTHAETGSTKVDVAYANDGTRTTTMLAGGATSTFTRDAAGRITAEQAADGTSLSYAYAPDGALREAGSGNGTLHIDTDAAGRPVKVTRSWNGGSASRAYRYDAQGRRIAVTTEDGTTDRTVYDALGRPAQQISGDGRTQTFAYDGAGHVAEIGTPEGRYAFRYDAAGRIVERDDPKTGRKRYAYDDAAHAATVTDAAGAQTRVRLDAYANPLEIVDAAGGKTSFVYDGDGRVQRFTDPLGHAWTYAYDAAGRLQHAVSPQGRKIEMSFDDRGRPLATTYGDGRSITRKYDSAGRLQSSDDGAGAFTYTYDGAHLTSIARNDATAQFAYDALGRIAKYTDPFGKSYALAFDAPGRLSVLSSADAGDVRFQYDRGRIGSIAAKEGGTAFAYDGASRVTAIAYPNGMRALYRYEPNGRIAEVRYVARNGAELYAERNRYDARGNLIAQDGTDGPRTYRYDALGRLTAGGPNASERYAYDAAGNVTSAPNAASWQYDDDQALTRAGDRTYTVDGSGNVASGGRFAKLTYVGRSQLTGATLADGTTVAFVYDAAGRRIEKRSGTQTVRSLYDGDSLLEQYDDKGTVLATYVPGPRSQWIAVRKDGATYYPIRTPAGTLVAVADARGAVVQRFRYDAFGAVVAKSGRPIVAPEFAGQPLDEETGLVRMGARYYAPELRRFISPDPRGPDSGGSLYAYALDNPLRYVDARGTNATVPPNIAAMTPQQRIDYANALIAQREAEQIITTRFGARDPAREAQIVEELVRMGNQAEHPSVERVVDQTLNALADDKVLDVRQVYRTRGLVPESGTFGVVTSQSPNSAFVFKDPFIEFRTNTPINTRMTGVAVHEVTHTLQDPNLAPHVLDEWEAHYNQWIVDRTVGTNKQPLNIEQLRDQVLNNYGHEARYSGQEITDKKVVESLAQDFFKKPAPIEDVPRVENAVDKLRAMREQGVVDQAAREIAEIREFPGLRGTTVAEGASDLAAKTRLGLFEAEMRGSRYLSQAASVGGVALRGIFKALPFVPAIVGIGMGLYHRDGIEMLKGAAEIRYAIPIAGEAMMAIDAGVWLGERAAEVYLAVRKRITDALAPLDAIGRDDANEDDETKGLRRRARRRNDGYAPSGQPQPVSIGYWEPPEPPANPPSSSGPNTTNAPPNGNANPPPNGNANAPTNNGNAPPNSNGNAPPNGGANGNAPASGNGANGNAPPNGNGNAPPNGSGANGNAPANGNAKPPPNGNAANGSAPANGNDNPPPNAGNKGSHAGTPSNGHNPSHGGTPSNGNNSSHGGTPSNGNIGASHGGAPPNAGASAPNSVRNPANGTKAPNAGSAHGTTTSAAASGLSHGGTASANSGSASTRPGSAAAPNRPSRGGAGGGSRHTSIDDALDTSFDDATPAPVAPPQPSQPAAPPAPHHNTGGIVGALNKITDQMNGGAGGGPDTPGGSIGTRPDDKGPTPPAPSDAPSPPPGGIDGPDPNDGIPPPPPRPSPSPQPPPTSTPEPSPAPTDVPPSAAPAVTASPQPDPTLSPAPPPPPAPPTASPTPGPRIEPARPPSGGPDTMGPPRDDKKRRPFPLGAWDWVTDQLNEHLGINLR